MYVEYVEEFDNSKNKVNIWLTRKDASNAG